MVFFVHLTAVRPLTGDAQNTVPKALSAATYLVGASTIAAGIINTGKLAFLNEVQKHKTQIISGDSFRHSNDFAERFDHSAMPAGVGGELSTGSDGHCCIGVDHTALADK